MESFVGIDIGGTSVKLGLIEYGGDQFRVVKQSSVPTLANESPAVFVQTIADGVKALIQAAGNPKVAGVGVGCPGLIDPWKGITRTSPNLPKLKEFPLRDRLSELLGLPVELQNDANAAVLGEWIFSPASKGVNNMILLTLGTGVGGGVVCDGHLLVGADNAATELGHMKAEYNSDYPCGCGRKGCVEAYVGAAGITRTAQLMIKSGAKTRLKSEKLTTKDIAQAATQGDEVAKQVLRKTGEYLGRGIAQLIEVFNPEKVVLGGGASAAIEFLMPGIQTALDQFASFAFTRNRCKIERSAFPDDINVIGAAATYVNAHRAK
ncbi:MAG TPA: ROK family protein [Tepidisphaeraceae bacterium]|nr:ROK family protein [Tepidisphaeraceae bacterium]